MGTRFCATALAVLLLCVAASAMAQAAGARVSATGAGTGAVAGAPQSSSTHTRLAAAWSDLWWTRDQQGERLLQSGQPGEAAERFSDPRHRAYADLAAGHDQDAARLLAPYRDPRSLYNLGNALARTGQLREALKAYDGALAVTPADRDARHNRALVARALQKQQHQNGGRGKQAVQAQGQGQGKGQPGQPGQRGQAGQQAHQRQGSQRQGSGSQSSQGQASQSQGSEQSQQRGGQQGQQRGQQQARTGEAQGDIGKDQDTAPSSPRDAALAAVGSGGRGQSAPPPSEQTLSLEQWLRRIPDDPGGLLRRKFLVEHLMRQQADSSADSAGATP